MAEFCNAFNIIPLIKNLRLCINQNVTQYLEKTNNSNNEMLNNLTEYGSDARFYSIFALYTLTNTFKRDLLQRRAISQDLRVKFKFREHFFFFLAPANVFAIDN